MTAPQYLLDSPIARVVERCCPGALLMRRRTAAETLAGMLDLQGSVRLAHCLGDPRRKAVEDASLHPPLLLGDYVRQRLTAIEEGMVRRLARPFDGARLRVADPAQVRVQLAEGREDGRAFAEAIWGTYRDLFLGSVGRVRADVAELREEVASDLRAAGERGKTLETVDGVVRAALNVSVPDLLGRLATAMRGAFVDALAAAVERLPAVIDDPAIAAWFGERGVLGAQIARTRELTRTFLVRDGQMVQTLVDATFAEGAA